MTVGENYTSKVLQIKLRDSSLTPFLPGRRPPRELAISPHPRSIRASPPVAKEKPLSDQE